MFHILLKISYFSIYFESGDVGWRGSPYSERRNAVFCVPVKMLEAFSVPLSEALAIRA